ncbi:Pentatricopeptide repeat-containing protein [Ananas comosus]|uniref:Pentatricopeptide repeat-containing protein n=1 Tax=Ananas comosus TaxID=4615 RepID=A0A199UHF6_ANACO|nr:Pentatricopeptide repeat-containing protein [Ananas comosus]
MAALVSALSAGRRLALAEGERAHRDAVARGHPLSPALGTALLDMYAKCGRVGGGPQGVRRDARARRGRVDAMSAALAAHGGRRGAGLFEEMVRRGCAPNRVAYVARCTRAATRGSWRGAGALERMRRGARDRAGPEH